MLGIAGPFGAFLGQADLALDGIDAEDLDVDLLPELHFVLRVLDFVVGQLGHVQQALQFRLQLDEDAEVGDLGDLAADHHAGLIAFGNGPEPRVLGHLLETQADAHLVLIDGEHDAAVGLGLLHDLGRVADLLGPAHVGHVQEAVDALLDLDERAVVREVADDALDDRAGRVLLGDGGPGVDLGLLHAERDFLLVLVDVEHHDLNLVGHVDHLGGVVDPAGPTHLGDVDEALDAGLELHEGAVVHDVDDFALHAGADGIALGDLFPRVLLQLFEAERDLLPVAVDVEHLDLDFLVDLQHLAGVLDAIPGHVRDVQQPVDPAQVHEAAEVGDVLDHALAYLADRDLFQKLGFLLGPFLLDELAAGDDDVSAFLVDLENLGFDFPADVFAHVGGAADVDLRSREEDRHADVDEQSTLDLAEHPALGRVAFVGGLNDAAPVEDAVGAPLGDDDHPRLVDVFDEHLHFGADLHVRRVVPLVERHDTFALEADVQHGLVAAQRDNLRFEDRVEVQAHAGLDADGFFQELVVDSLAEGRLELGVQIGIGDFDGFQEVCIKHEFVRPVTQSAGPRSTSGASAKSIRENVGAPLHLAPDPPTPPEGKTTYYRRLAARPATGNLPKTVAKTVPVRRESGASPLLPVAVGSRNAAIGRAADG